MPTINNLPVLVTSGLLAALAVFTGAYLIVWIRAVSRARTAGVAVAGVEPALGKKAAPSLAHLGIGLLTNFLDTLGIGSFATTTSLFRLRGLVPDRVIPGTLNVGHTLPTVVEASIYMTIVEVGPTTLVLMIGASIVGAWLGAGIVAAWPKRKVQIGMGCALLAAAGLMLMSLLGLLPGGGDALSIAGTRLWVGLIGNLILGALMTLGIGLYAPCMILISLLGMNPKAAYPIMMGSCAFLMPVGSVRFIKKESYDLRAALGLALGGIPGVLLAAYIVWEMDLEKVRWLVVIVVLYTATMMLRSAFIEAKQKEA